MTRILALHLILGLVALWPTLSAEDAVDDPPASRKPRVQLELPPTSDGAPGPLDWIFEKVPGGSDQWTTEGLNDKVSALLKKLAGEFKKPSVDSELAKGLFTADFRGTPPALRKLQSVYKNALLEAWRSVPSVTSTPDLDRSRWLGEISRLRSQFVEVTKAKFKVYGIHERRTPRHTAKTQVLLELDGRAASSGLLQLRTLWELEWTNLEHQPRIYRMVLTHFEKVLQKRRSFTDVTEELLGSQSSYPEQLSHGVGFWRSRIDSSSGIDIYGHQGLSVGDVNGDGWDDFYVPQPAGLPDRLFVNVGGKEFVDVSYEAGVDILDQSGGPLLIDLDNDGDSDLVVTTSLEALVFENDGQGHFQRRSLNGLEVASNRHASSLGCAAADYDNDGDLDIYLFSYIFWVGGGSKLHSTFPYPYHNANNGAPNFLFRNDGGFRFTDVTHAAGMEVNNRRFSLAASWCDFDNDGDPDLYVANDFGRNNLFLNHGDGTFEDVAEKLGVEDVGNGMSVTWEDYDNDGHFDLYVGNMWSAAGQRLSTQNAFTDAKLSPFYQRMARGNTLFRNRGDGTFVDVSDSSGTTFGRWAWSCQFLDVEGDGFEDLYVLNGFISNEEKDDL